MSLSSLFTYCPHCSALLHDVVSDQVRRRRCPECGWVQYRNPTVGVAVVLIEETRLLLGRRRSGGWCIPCGHVEFDETVEEAAVREMEEETGLTVSLHGVCAVKSNFHNPEHQTVGIWFRGQRMAGSLRAGGDLVEVAFRDLGMPPGLIFPTDREVVNELQELADQPAAFSDTLVTVSNQPPKSAVELAMERLRQQDAEAGIERTQLTDAQKRAVAEAQRTYDAKVAECRILHDAALLATMDPDKRRELDANYRRDLGRFATDRDRQMEAARKGAE